MIDLTHALHEDVPHWTGRCGFHSEIKMDYDEGVRVMKYRCLAGVGTHIDAPSHFIEGGANVADIPLEELSVPVHVIDMTREAHPDLFITPKDIAAYEKEHGKVSKGSLFVGYTGWEKYWGDTDAFRHVGEDGHMHFPGFTAEAAELLLERGVVGVGIDTFSPDGSNSHGYYPVHQLVLGAGKYIVENLANLGKMPPKGGRILCLPMKVRDGAEAAIRAVGYVA